MMTFILSLNRQIYAEEISSYNWVGIIKSIRGSAKIGERELSTKDRIYRNEIIKTSNKSMAIIELMDRTEIKLGPKSEFRIDKWVYHNEHDRDSVMSILKGQIRAHVKSKTKYGEQIEFKTNTVSMGIRGTEFLVNVIEELKSEITQIALIEGLIHLHGSDIIKDQFINPGDQINFINNQSGKKFEIQKFDIENFNINQDDFLSPLTLNINKENKIKNIIKSPEQPASNNVKPWRNTLEELNRLRSNI